MQKKTKGMVAAAAGLTVLLASGATFATWVDTTNIGTSNLTADTGDLRLGQNVAFAWDGDAPERWVPGQSHTATATVASNLLGDNLVAELTVENVTTNLAATAPFKFELAVQQGASWTPVTLGDTGAAWTLPTLTPTQTDTTFRLTVTFDEATDGLNLPQSAPLPTSWDIHTHRNRANAETVTGQLGLRLSQVITTN